MSVAFSHTVLFNNSCLKIVKLENSPFCTKTPLVDMLEHFHSSQLMELHKSQWNKHNLVVLIVYYHELLVYVDDGMTDGSIFFTSLKSYSFNAQAQYFDDHLLTFVLRAHS